MVLTDEMQKCNPKPIIIKTEAKHTMLAHSNRIIYASIPVRTDHSITGTMQPLPLFAECSKLMIAPAITTAGVKKVAIEVAKTTYFPYTIPADTKLAELQILKTEETKMIRSVDIAALNLLTKHDDVVTYIHGTKNILCWRNGSLRLAKSRRQNVVNSSACNSGQNSGNCRQYHT